MQSEGVGYDLTRVSWIVRRPNGDLIVLDAARGDLLEFNNGTLLRRIGRYGAGPGEFTAPSGLGLFGDTLWVFDDALSRISIFDSVGHFRSSLPMRAGGSGVLLRDATIGLIPYRVRRSQGETEQRFRVRRFRASGDSLPDVLSRRVVYRSLKYSAGGRVIVGRQPFDFAPFFQATADGGGFLQVERELPRSSTGTVVLTNFSPSGSPRYVCRLPYRAKELTGATIDSVARSIATPPGAPEVPGAYDVVREALFKPPFLPSVTAVVDGPDGTVWLRREDEGGPMIEWTIFTHCGVAERRIALPRLFFPHIVWRDHAIGVEKDSDDTPTVVQYDF